MKYIAFLVVTILSVNATWGATARANVGATIIGDTAGLRFDRESQSTIFVSAANQAVSLETGSRSLFESTTGDGTLTLSGSQSTISFE